MLLLEEGMRAVAEKRYEVIRPFRWADPKTGADTHYKVGDVYPGPVNKPYLLDPAGPDGKGPLLLEKTIPTPAPAAPSVDSSKEK